ncbi:prolyl 4-hydroxylase subunit alpha-2-like [Paramacrobiotus metropolitanus]|uniref:prolyl 4-hydroxylase subunit alpha-2-like n=1 Tax=Paramacrobiotus metropolitanus TaxID=2943436 RepID=UPI002445631C|nr:prolyl 4-hydroxylase subunit alpha-2-like [Paramacrobiotus metropolitanus]
MTQWPALFVPIIISTIWRQCYGEVFSSTAHMQSVISTEIEMVKQLEEYIALQEAKVDKLAKYIDKLSALSEDAEKHGILHPAVAFLHSKVLSRDLDELIEYYTKHREAEQKAESIRAFRKKQPFAPDENDLRGAVIALTRLQRTYKITAKELADGSSPALPTDQPKMSVSDCYTVANELFKQEWYDQSYEWFEIVWNRCTNRASGILLPDPDGECTASVVASALAKSSYILYHVDMNTTAAVLQAAEALAYEESNRDALDYIKLYYTPLSDYHEDLVNWTQSDQSDAKHPVHRDDRFDSLCRGEDNDRDHRTKQKRPCYQISFDKPFLKAQPVRVEQLSADPYILIYRNFMHPKETDHMIRIGTEFLARAVVQRPTHLNGSQAVTDYDMDQVTFTRTAKTAWFNHDYNELTRAISARIHQFTGLDMSGAEQLQLANYGIGGHYYPHYDYFGHGDPRMEPKELEKERIATFMVYLTDVQAGGATVFINQNITVWPRKGDAVFWYNLHRDGKGHKGTLHAGCPVLAGNKWVLNVWIRTEGQELIRPCLMQPDSPTETQATKIVTRISEILMYLKNA